MKYLFINIFQVVLVLLVVVVLFSVLRSRSLKRVTYRYILKVFTYLVLTALVVLVTILLVHGFHARSKPDLALWHQVRLKEEFKASDYTDTLTLQDYLAREERLFAELQEKVYHAGPAAGAPALNRYAAGSPCDPDQFETNWNRTYELFPETIQGGVLLVHGLTDSPYSLRTLARIFQQNHFYVLNLRMPGHGTVPSALQVTTWQDWLAAVKLGMRHVKGVIGSEVPLYLLGYSNGGALATLVTLESLEQPALATPDRVILLSPAIGITKLAGLAGWLNSLGFIPFFAKSQWQTITPEFDPFKYNSFPLFAGQQSFALAQVLQKRIEQARTRASFKMLPPIMTFQSVVDTTVIAEDTVEKLYDKMPRGQSELILFDINRHGLLQQFLKSDHDKLLAELAQSTRLPYQVTLITNSDADQIEVIAKSKPAGGNYGPARQLNLTWPSQIYSLSHRALPIPPDDPLYGSESAARRFTLSSLQLRGERGLLSIPTDDLMRMLYNPFFAYFKIRIEAWIAADCENRPDM